MPGSVNLEGRKQLLRYLDERACDLYRACAPERQRMWAEYPPPQTDNIATFVSIGLKVEGDQIWHLAINIYTGTQEFNFANVKWFTQDNGHDNLKAYIVLLDHIRLACLEYMTVAFEDRF